MFFVVSLLLTLFLVFLIKWLIAVLLLNDFSLPVANLKRFKNVLVVFPHPDDEVLTTGGFFKRCADEGIATTLAILTKGEKGTPDAHLENGLKKIRTLEAQRVATLLQVTTLIQLDMGDGELKHKLIEVRNEVENILKQKSYDLVITYDLTGLYGHPDHIALSEVVTSLLRQKYPQVVLWYTSLPARVLSLLNLPEHMAEHADYKKRRVMPTCRVPVFFGVQNKITALYTYQSQRLSFKSGMPAPFIPLWWFVSLGVNEYFHEVSLR